MSINLEEALKRINKGKRVEKVKTLGSDVILREHVSTGSAFLDHITGGGYAVGCYNLLVALGSVGKTTMSLLACKSVLSQGYHAAFMDGENTITESYLSRVGFTQEERDRFILIKGRNLESMLDDVEQLALVETMRIIVIDSIHVYTATAVEDKSADQDYMAIEARKYQQRFPIIEGNARGRAAIIGINTAREAIHSGNYIKEVVPRGAWQNTAANTWLRMTRGDVVFKDEVPIGHKVNVRVIKTKDNYYDGKKSHEIILYYNGGFDNYEQYSELFLTYGIVRQAGAWFYYFDEDGVEQKAQGKPSLIKAIKGDAVAFERMKVELSEMSDSINIIGEEISPDEIEEV